MVLWVLLSLVLSAPLPAQTPRVPPRTGFVFHDEHKAGIFEVQRWVDAADPEVSPSGICFCITVVYLGDRKVLSIDPGGLLSTTIDARSGQDINSDKVPDLIVTQYTGGAHCCTSTTVYSVSTETKTLLEVDTGNCEGEFEDLDKDGTLEFVTCDDAWAYENCAFAFSPMPRVVYAYSAKTGKYVPATPLYRNRFESALTESIARAEKEIVDPARDPNLDACTVLGPVLELMYAGRFDEGVVLLRRLYRRADASELERKTIERVRTSSFWVP